MADWIDAGRVKIIPKGEYSDTTQYTVDDICTYSHYAYICVKDCIGIHPVEDESSEYWEQFGSAPQIATTETAGLVKPDGSTISIDDDGTIHGAGGTAESITFDPPTSMTSTNVQDALEEENDSISHLTPSVLTQEEFNNLTDDELENGKDYIISDGEGGFDDIYTSASAIKTAGDSGTLLDSDLCGAKAAYEINTSLENVGSTLFSIVSSSATLSADTMTNIYAPNNGSKKHIFLGTNASAYDADVTIKTIEAERNYGSSYVRLSSSTAQTVTCFWLEANF